MSQHRDLKKNKEKIKKKNDLPVLDSDRDFLNAFLSDDNCSKQGKKKPAGQSDQNVSRVNKHGLPFIEDYETRFQSEPEEKQDPDSDTAPERPTPEEDFASLLDESLKQRKPSRQAPKPMPLKRRLSRYPLPEKDLDLHGFTAIGAEIKARSFVLSAHQQGFFTLRIIVGRGLHSEDGPVLPHVIEALLNTLKKENVVLAYEWERKKKVKSGAVIVFLKRFSD